MSKEKFVTTKRIKTPDGTIIHMINIEGVNKIHNWDGPALINEEKKIKEYYLSGIKYTKSEWDDMVNPREELPPSKKPAPPGYTNRC